MIKYYLTSWKIKGLFTIIVNLLPYYLIRYAWYRRFIHIYTRHKYVPLDIDGLNHNLEACGIEDFDIYIYYEHADLDMYKIK